jgi:hypothetical protein
MADKKISQLSAASTPLAGTEVLPIVQGGSTVKVSAADVTAGRAVSALTYTSTATTGTAPFTVSSTTQVANLNAATAGTASNLLSNATTGLLQVAGPGAGTTRVMTTPNANFTAARTDAGQTFTGDQVITGGLTVDTNTLYVDAANNLVGINRTPSAGFNLDVDTSGATYPRLTGSDQANVRLRFNNGGAGGRIWELVGGLPGANNSAFSLYDVTGTATRLNVDTSGNLTVNAGNLAFGTSGKGIVDTNGNESMLFTATASAVNELTVANAATGNNPVVSATGGDTNIGITLTPKGSGNTFVSANNLIISAAALPTISGEGSPKAIRLNDALIISGSGSIASPYSQNIQIDIVWGNWGANPALALVDLSVALREFAGTAGCVFGTLFAINSSGATFTSFTTAGITTSQATLTATSPANYTLRITIDPTSGTDRYGYYLTIPTMAGGTASTVESVTVSLV